MDMQHSEYHQPDMTEIPLSLRSLDWKPMPPQTEILWTDGQELLIAVPIIDKTKMDGWRYEFSVITLHTDDGEIWGWDLNSVDFYVTIGA